MLTLLPILLLGQAAAGEFQSTTALDALVAQFTGKAVGEPGGARTPVDGRLRLASCAAPQLEWRTPTRDAVVVRCMAPTWRLFVAVNIVAPPPAAPAAVVPSAAAPAPAPVRVEPIIRRGDPVTVEARAAGFSITRDAIAMGDAAPGARLMVRVEDNRPPIQEVAVAAGRVTLPAWAN